MDCFLLAWVFQNVIPGVNPAILSIIVTFGKDRLNLLSLRAERYWEVKAGGGKQLPTAT